MIISQVSEPCEKALQTPICWATGFRNAQVASIVAEPAVHRRALLHGTLEPEIPGVAHTGTALSAVLTALTLPGFARRV